MNTDKGKNLLETNEIDRPGATAFVKAVAAHPQKAAILKALAVYTGRELLGATEIILVMTGVAVPKILFGMTFSWSGNGIDKGFESLHRVASRVQRRENFRRFVDAIAAINCHPEERTDKLKQPKNLSPGAKPPSNG